LSWGADAKSKDCFQTIMLQIIFGVGIDFLDGITYITRIGGCVPARGWVFDPADV
jgi:hypothetical protein